LKYVPFIITLITLLSLFLSFIYEVEVIAVSKGKIIPENDVMHVNSTLGGKVMDVFVSNGIKVNAGDNLVRYDLSNEENHLKIFLEERDDLREQLNVLNGFSVDEHIGNERLLSGYEGYIDKDYVRKVLNKTIVIISKIKEFRNEMESIGVQMNIAEIEKKVSLSKLKRIELYIDSDSQLVSKGLIKSREYEAIVHDRDIHKLKLDEQVERISLLEKDHNSIEFDINSIRHELKY
ncbi:HlyD family secretion protein, partial [Vibrio penaeicida]